MNTDLPWWIIITGFSRHSFYWILAIGGSVGALTMAAIVHDWWIYHHKQ